METFSKYFNFFDFSSRVYSTNLLEMVDRMQGTEEVPLSFTSKPYKAYLYWKGRAEIDITGFQEGLLTIFCLDPMYIKTSLVSNKQ